MPDERYDQQNDRPQGERPRQPRQYPRQPGQPGQPQQQYYPQQQQPQRQYTQQPRQGQRPQSGRQNDTLSGPAPYRPREADARRSRPRQSPSYYPTSKPIGSLNKRRKRRPTPIVFIAAAFVVILLIVFFTSQSFKTMIGKNKGDDVRGESGSGTSGTNAGVVGTDQTTPDATIPTGTDAETTPPPSSADLVIFIDPGHGFDDGGATSEYFGDYNERDITLMVAKEAVEILKDRGYNVQLTHDGVTLPRASTDNGDNIFSAFGAEKNERSVYVNEHNVGLFVSLHCDALPSDTSVSGTRIHFCDDYAYTDDASSFADTLIDKIGSAFSGSRSVKKFGHTPDDSYNVTRFVNAPSVLIEMGFVTNESDAQLLLDPEWRSTLAAGVADGIAAFIAGYTPEE